MNKISAVCTLATIATGAKLSKTPTSVECDNEWHIDEWLGQFYRDACDGEEIANKTKNGHVYFFTGEGKYSNYYEGEEHWISN